MEIETTAIRILLLVLMLGIASIFDVKTRKIPDVVWMIFGGLGTILYVFDDVTFYEILSMVTTGAIAILLYLYKITGTGDVFAIISMAVILPVHYGFVMVSITVMVASFFLVVLFVMSYNVSLNASDMIRTRKIMFSEFNEPKYRKIFAFFAIHRKRKFERFVIPAEKSLSITPNTKSFVLSSSKKSFDNSQMESNDTIFVQNIPPLIAYMFGIAVFLLLPEIISVMILNPAFLFTSNGIWVNCTS